MSRKAAGFTLVEVSVILLAVLVVLSIVLVNVGDFSRLARFARVRDDVTRLCSALARLVLDTGDLVSHEGGDDPNAAADALPVGLMIGDGHAPALNSESPGASGAPWLLAEGDPFEQRADYTGALHRFTVDTLANHLLHNTPAGPSSRGYRTATDGADGLFAWRGPYVADRIEADPWGNRYMANVFSLYVPPSPDGGQFRSAVVCYSAGADEEVDTAFNQPRGWANGDDDVTAFVALGGRL